jgi:signal transduction histidine kinase
LSPDQLDIQDTEKHIEVYTTVGPAAEPLRAMARSLIMAGHATRIIVAHSMEDSISTLHRFRNILLAFGAIGTLLMACVGWAISRRAVVPLRNFSDRINQISEQTLARRIDVERQPREFGNLADAFNRMLDRLQKSISAREELLSNVSHELKTPVTVIRTHCDVYLQKERPPAEYVEALRIIRKAADAMGRKIRRLLAMAHTEADLMHGCGVRSLALDECLRKARVTIEPLAREHRVEISERIAPGLKIHGHGERLVEAFSNLLENAVKYNQQGGTVTIFADKRDDQIQIRIEDSGCGISPGEIDQVFKRFYRGSSTGQTEGTGLGLFLVKKIIEANRGRIEVDSHKEAGTTFTVSLPQG